MTSKWLRRLYLNRSVVTFLHDGVVASLSLWVALFLRVGNNVFLEKYIDLLTLGTPLFAVIALTTYHFFGMYRGLWRYASVPDLVTIVKANTLAILIFLPFLFLVTRLEAMPRTVPFIQWLLLIMILGGSRMAYRALRSHQWVIDSSESYAYIPVLVYGSGDEAEQFIRATRVRGIYKPVGILDDRRTRKGLTLHGIKVLGSTRELTRILQTLKRKGIRPQKIIIADKDSMEIKGAPIRALSDRAAAAGLTIARLPKLTDIQRLDVEEGILLQPIAIEDLLGRPQNVMNKPQIEAMLTGKRILITGAGGSIGSEITLQIAGFNPSALCLLDSSEHNLYMIDMRLREEGAMLKPQALLADVRDEQRLRQIFNGFKPDIVFHAAAYKHVPMVEANPAEGVLTNIIGTRNVANAAQECGAIAMVQISTDKAVNPTNVMGATKKLAEMLCQALDSQTEQKTRFMTVRFGNVLDSSGSVVPLFRRQLERGGPLTVTDKRIERYFMTIPEAVGLVLSASAYGLSSPERGRIFVLDMGEPIKIDDLARQMIRLAGLEPDRDIKIVYTGLRPGEKLFEELFNEDEKPEPTDLVNINAAEPAMYPMHKLLSIIQQLEQSAVNDAQTDIRSFLMEAVPNFLPMTQAA